MREIKFRAWDKEEKKMVYKGFDIDPEGNIWINQFNVSDFYILMQDTGLKDKNGVRIYFDDIVLDHQTSPDKRNTRVIRCLADVCWLYQDMANQEENVHEVISSIYENPEFIKEYSLKK